MDKHAPARINEYIVKMDYYELSVDWHLLARDNYLLLLVIILLKSFVQLFLIRPQNPYYMSISDFVIIRRPAGDVRTLVQRYDPVWAQSTPQTRTDYNSSPKTLNL